MKANRYVRKYHRMVKCAIPRDYPHRTRIVGNMQDLVETYIAEHPDAGYEELQEQFGSPEELAASLVDNLTSEEVLRLFKRRKWWGIAVVVTAIVAAFLITVGLINIAERSRVVEITEVLTIYEDEPYSETEE